MFIVCRIVRPKIVRNFISNFANKHNNFNKTEACFLGGAFVVVEFTELLYKDNFVLRLEALGVKIRTGLTSLIYRKVLQMKLSQHDNIPVGKIMTMITRDVNEFDISVLYSTTACCNSLRFLITYCVIYMEIGPSFAILLDLFCIIILMQGK
jgi:ABC-type transport system involved in cytochrome bd biosynthesis fused ATPase/permease subunit